MTKYEIWDAGDTIIFDGTKEQAIEKARLFALDVTMAEEDCVEHVEAWIHDTETGVVEKFTFPCATVE